jgi:hypothetical protein
VSLLTSSAVTALNKEREVIALNPVREQEYLGYRIKFKAKLPQLAKLSFKKLVRFLRCWSCQTTCHSGKGIVCPSILPWRESVFHSRGV